MANNSKIVWQEISIPCILVSGHELSDCNSSFVPPSRERDREIQTNKLNEPSRQTT